MCNVTILYAWKFGPLLYIFIAQEIIKIDSNIMNIICFTVLKRFHYLYPCQIPYGSIGTHRLLTLGGTSTEM